MLTKGPITTNTNTDILESNGIKLNVFLKGTWGGATLTLQASPDGTEEKYVPLANGAFTADGGCEVNLNPGVKLRAVTTSTSGSTSLSVYAV